jgi:small subunit ribosomal protein S16
MVRIRLRRIGAKKQPSYRLVAAEKESPRDGRFLETLGHYNPRTTPATIELQEDRIFYWLSVGAQPSESVMSLFRTMGTMERFARYKAGEELEKLMAEAAAVAAAHHVSVKTRPVEGFAQKKPKKAEA